MPGKFTELESTDALQNASQLYNTYVELAHLAELAIPTEDEEDASEYFRSLDHPLGLVITTTE